MKKLGNIDFAKNFDYSVNEIKGWLFTNENSDKPKTKEVANTNLIKSIASAACAGVGLFVILPALANQLNLPLDLPTMERVIRDSVPNITSGDIELFNGTLLNAAMEARGNGLGEKLSRN